MRGEPQSPHKHETAGILGVLTSPETLEHAANVAVFVFVVVLDDGVSHEVGPYHAGSSP